jgi:uncharacterized protein YggE
LGRLARIKEIQFMRIFAILVTMAVLASPVLAGDGRATITVTGEGVVHAAPDMATLSMGVSTEGESAQAALGANSEQLAAVLARLKAAGIEDRDIQTSGLSLGPRYDYSSSGEAPKTTGYVASNMVTVRVRALGSLGEVLDKAVADGANALNGVTFGLQDPNPSIDAARRLAIADALYRAKLYAEAAGVNLGKVVKIDEANGFSRPMPTEMAGFAKSADVPVAAGELDISATVTVIYEIAD